jgi:1-phosphatidylinositol-4-phosphate 5-kinase
MPFILDPGSTSTHSPGQVPQDGDLDHPHSLGTSSSSSGPPPPHRTQSTTAILHHPLRLPPTIPEDSSNQDASANASNGSPRRARASTGVSKSRASAERLAEEDASWWTEEIHKRREIRRRWKEVEDENTVVLGNKVDTNHPNYVTAYNMLTGLRVAVRPPLCQYLQLGISS